MFLDLLVGVQSHPLPVLQTQDHHHQHLLHLLHHHPHHQDKHQDYQLIIQTLTTMLDSTVNHQNPATTIHGNLIPILATVTHGNPVTLIHGNPVTLIHGEPAVTAIHGNQAIAIHGNPVTIIHGNPAVTTIHGSLMIVPGTLLLSITPSIIISRKIHYCLLYCYHLSWKIKTETQKLCLGSRYRYILNENIWIC